MAERDSGFFRTCGKNLFIDWPCGENHFNASWTWQGEFPNFKSELNRQIPKDFESLAACRMILGVAWNYICGGAHIAQLEIGRCRDLSYSQSDVVNVDFSDAKRLRCMLVVGF